MGPLPTTLQPPSSHPQANLGVAWGWPEGGLRGRIRGGRNRRRRVGRAEAGILRFRGAASRSVAESI
jgi:hypothetical protein